MFVKSLAGIACGRLAGFVRVIGIAAAVSLCSTALAATVDVYVFNNEFSIRPPGEPIEPAVITVGDTVRWVWVQGHHTTTSVMGIPEQWNALITSSYPEFSYTFTHEGVFWYYCAPHGSDNGDGTAEGMVSTVTVLAPGLGACCLSPEVGGGCIETSPADCMIQSGTYQGDGEMCNAKPCLDNPVTVTLIAAKNNVLYETVDGSTSNALGRHLYAGNSSLGQRRRSVVAFDLSEIPQGVTIHDAQLQLHCNSSGGAAFDVAVHRVLSEWGEGTSQATGNEGTGAPATAGDATWLHAFFPKQFWTTPGGDFAAKASATAEVSVPNTAYTWTSETLIADVQHWLDSPAMNFGWIVRGDETSGSSAKRFDSRNALTAANHPRLIVTYVSPDVVGDLNGDGAVDVSDLLILLGAWGPCDCPADLNGDGVVDVSDLLILLGNWG